MSRSVLLLILALFVTRAPAVELSGEIGAHDPSRIIKFKDTYWFFSTGKGCRSSWSTNLFEWHAGPRVFQQFPEWVQTALPYNNRDAWAPDIVRLKDRFALYYSVSMFGRRDSVIGLATNPTLDPTDPKFGWKDEGLVIKTGDTNEFNAIDPSIFEDTDHTLWMVFGSYWSGIKLVQIEPTSGKILTPGKEPYALAWHESIEASYLHKHGDYYYLFVNWDTCCQGVNSLYNIRIGRSRSITGPYIDRDGVDMLKSGGSLFLGAEGRFIGPGHASIFAENNTEWFSYHYYDAKDDGEPKIGLRRLTWKNDWPVLE